MPDPGRRPLKTRSKRWAIELSKLLTKLGVSPNAISIAGIVVAAIGGVLLILLGRGSVPSWLALAAAGACVQLRLLCNMLDGLVAVEGGLKSKAGDLFNELPDRIEDTLLLVGAGHAAGVTELGWLCAALALLTAYIRALGTSLGQPGDFRGPGAKPHRMFLLTVGCLAALVFFAALKVTLWVIAVVTLLTIVRRTIRLYLRLP